MVTMINLGFSAERETLITVGLFINHDLSVTTQREATSLVSVHYLYMTFLKKSKGDALTLVGYA